MAQRDDFTLCVLVEKGVVTIIIVLSRYVLLCTYSAITCKFLTLAY